MEILNSISQKFADKVEVVEGLDYHTFMVEKDNLLDIVSDLKAVFGFNFMIDITAVEYDEYIQAVYHFMNLDEKLIIRIKVNLEKDKPVIPSLVNIYKGADLQERESFDLMGVKYEGHPNLKRVLCPDEFEGHPLRKDFSMRDRGLK
ncbi:MAG: hypothetical protein APF76_04945 [Desulfitibacter sp. BRH_c19]|nr:MAG: hypothetical protein APF76_04945 [Desulfitibacter sp. BRH_c19]